jgi:hypothetical protein
MVSGLTKFPALVMVLQVGGQRRRGASALRTSFPGLSPSGLLLGATARLNAACTTTEGPPPPPPL